MLDPSHAGPTRDKAEPTVSFDPARDEQHRDTLLDAALDESFPASDPPQSFRFD